MEHWLFGLAAGRFWLVHPLCGMERRDRGWLGPGTLLGPEGTAAREGRVSSRWASSSAVRPRVPVLDVLWRLVRGCGVRGGVGLVLIVL